MKKVPYFWWDFTMKTYAIIVESDHPKYKILAIYYFNGDAEEAIEKAEKLIADLRAGRVSMKNVARM